MSLSTQSVTDKSFETDVINSSLPVLVDFWAEWCGPCRMVAPIVQELSEDYAGRLVVGKVDVDSNPGIASKFGIRNIPTILFFKDGAVVDKHVGAAPKSTLSTKVEGIL